jgi:hypothetical protein
VLLLFLDNTFSYVIQGFMDLFGLIRYSTLHLHKFRSVNDGWAEWAIAHPGFVRIVMQQL